MCTEHVREDLRLPLQVSWAAGGNHERGLDGGSVAGCSDEFLCLSRVKVEDFGFGTELLAPGVHPPRLTHGEHGGPALVYFETSVREVLRLVHRLDDEVTFKQHGRRQ